MSITIDSNVPLPPASNRKGPGVKTPFRLALEALNVGQSLIVPEGTPDHTASNLRHTLRPKRFQMRTTDEGRRIWRTA